MTEDKLKEKARDIAKRYPESLKAYPRGNFEEQLAEFLIKEGLVK